MKLSQWAKKNGINYKTAHRWFQHGRIPNARQLDTGTILVDEPEDINVLDELKKINDQLKEIKKLLEESEK